MRREGLVRVVDGSSVGIQRDTVTSSQHVEWRQRGQRCGSGRQRRSAAEPIGGVALDAEFAAAKRFSRGRPDLSSATQVEAAQSFGVPRVQRLFGFAQQVEGMLEDDFSNCREVGRRDYKDKPAWYRLAARFARLMAPIQ